MAYVKEEWALVLTFQTNSGHAWEAKEVICSCSCSCSYRFLMIIRNTRMDDCEERREVWRLPRGPLVWFGSKVMMSLRMEGRQSQIMFREEYIELAVCWTLSVMKEAESKMNKKGRPREWCSHLQIGTLATVDLLGKMSLALEHFVCHSVCWRSP